MNYSEVVARAAATLVATGMAAVDAEADATVLARHILNWDLAHWLGHMRDKASPAFVDALNTKISRRATREPIAYITGEREFYGRPFIVSPAVLIPRPETELVVELALVHGCTGAQVHGCTIADIGTGSGCLAITIALEISNARLVATDISRSALEVARLNALVLGAGEQIEFREGAFFAGTDDTFDLIVSNPPYVADRDRGTLMSDVVDFEPSTALFSGEDGLDCIRELLRLAPARLKPGGTLIFEFGFGQDEAVGTLVETSSLKLVGITSDLQGIPRVAIAAL